MAARFARYLSSPLSPIVGINVVISPLDLRARKVLLTICRCQVVPRPQSKLIRQIQQGYPEYTRPAIWVPTSKVFISLSSIVDSLESYIIHPIPNGFLQMVIKVLPLEPDDVTAAIMEGYAKEIVASQERRYTPMTNIQSILSPYKKDRRVPLLVGWDCYNSGIHDYIYGQLLQATSLLTTKPYYPNYGRKALPKTSLSHFQELQEVYGYHFDDTTCGMEALYSRIGLYPEGPTEMKHAFKYNDLRPRIYFSRGSTHYVPSKFIQEIFNRIMEAFPCIHKFERFHISRLEIQHDQIFMVYDFSVFTTNLQSLSGFLHALGDLYSHLEITVIDTFLGPQVINLGEYIHAYARDCNDNPRFETYYGSQDGEPISFTSGAGLLGIPGNISSSTLWHAVILMCLVQSLLAKVVGDDAGVALPSGEIVPKLVKGLREFGDVSLPKTEDWSHIDIMMDVELVIWQYVKRQIYRLEDKIHCGETPMQFPNPSLFIENFADEFHAVTHIKNPVVASIKCANRFVHACQKYSILEQSEEIIEMCRQYHNFILRRAREDDKDKSEKKLPRYPFFQDVTDASFEGWYSGLPGIVRIPMLASSADMPSEWRIMTKYRVHMSKAVKLIIDLEYGSIQMVTMVVKNTEIEVLREVYEHRVKPCYFFVIFEGCPSFLIDLLPSSLSSPIDDDFYYTEPIALPSLETIDMEDLFD